MGWGEDWEQGAHALTTGGAGNPIGPPPWPKSTENHRAGLYSTRYWWAVREAGGGAMLEGPGVDLRDWLRRQREEGLFLREALGPTYDAAWVAHLLIAWTAAEERVKQEPRDLIAQEIRDLALGAIRFALGMALTLRVPDGTVFAPGPRAKDLETAGHLERGLTVLAHWWSPVERPHEDLLRHLKPGGRWLEDQHGAAKIILELASLSLRRVIVAAGGPTLQGRLSHPLYWRRDDDGTLDCWAPWMHVRKEDGGAHGRSGVWANFGWRAKSRGDAEPVGWIQGGELPAGGVARHPNRDHHMRLLDGWHHVGPTSEPWPLANVTPSPAPPPAEEPPAPEGGGVKEARKIIKEVRLDKRLPGWAARKLHGALVALKDEG